MQKGAFSEQEERTTEDVWFDDLHDWLLTKDETPFKFKEIFEPGGPLGNRREPNDQRRISEILTKLGCERFRIRKEGGKQRFWVKKSE